MTDIEYNALKATMPWRDQTFQSPRGGLIQVIDRNGQEVPLFAMVRFLTFITAKLTQQPAQETQPNQEQSA